MANREDLLTAIADGTPIDWSEVEHSVDDPHERRRLVSLRRVERVVRQHRLASAQLRRSVAVGREPAAKTLGAECLSPGDHWGHLTIVEAIGAGGFSIVYRAWDPRLQREVALKIRTRPAISCQHEVGSDEEGRLLARLRHPHIVPVYGADCIGGRSGLWMELVRGLSLEQIIREQGPFGAREAGAIGLEICNALAAVHNAGLLHRDVKTQNVVREKGGRLVLMDLGTARDMSASPLTDVSGTPLYLAPELLRGEGCSRQSDLYSLGVLIYRLVTAAYPVEATTLAELRDAHACGTRVPLRDARPDLPDAFVRTVERALSPRPADRFSSAGEMELALAICLSSSPQNPNAHGAEGQSASKRFRLTRRRAMMGLALAAASIVIGWKLLVAPLPAGPFNADDWVLVADFVNDTGEADLDRVVSYAIERELAVSSRVNVVPQQRIDDSLRLMKRPLAQALDEDLARQVAQRDGSIRLILAGHIQKVDASYVVVAKIVSPTDGRTLGVAHAEAAGRAVLPRAIGRVAEAVRRTLGEADDGDVRTPLERVTTPSLRALQLYTDSYQLGQSARWQPALELARQSVIEDPEFAAAYIWLAWALRNTGAAPAEYEAAATRAASLAASCSPAERLWILGSQHMLRNEDAKAEATFLALLQQQPNHFWATNNLGFLYERQHRFREALQFDVAVASMRPNHAFAQFRAAHRTVQVTGRFDAARRFVLRAREVGALEDPAIYVWALFFDAAEQLARRDVEAVADTTHRLLADRQGHSEAARYFLATTAVRYYLSIGRIEEARQTVDLLQQVSVPGPYPSFAPTNVSQFPYLSARVAFTSGEWDVARRALSNVTPSVSTLGAALLAARLGMAAEALAVARIHPDTHEMVRAFLQAAEGRSSTANDRTLESIAVSTDRPGHLDAAVYLAESSLKKMEPAKAIDVLQRSIADTRSLDFQRPGPSAHEWAENAFLLAGLYRQTGQSHRAEPIEADLHRLLSTADPDLPLLRRLSALREHPR